MEFTFIDNTGTAIHRASLRDDIDPKELAKDLLSGGREEVLVQCHGMQGWQAQLAYKAAKDAWEIEVKGVSQKTGEEKFARYTRTVKL